ncbi:MAG: hypothetical protein FJW38_01775 [Acidobacteria bacterium]|nr:hypothetical protein [Acidobacteriota bacterium]
MCAAAAYAQSTFGVVLGDVRDSSGAIVRDAKVKLTNTAENVSRETTSNANGSFEFQNVKAGPYAVSVSAAGFRTFNAASLELVARQTLRVDAALQVGDVTQVIEVTTAAGVIATDSPAIASSLSPEKVLNLPSNLRAAGNTSPYGLLQTLPGVQSDNGSGFSIHGGLPAQSEASVDGISITQLTGNSVQQNQFLSVESISEIRVQGVGNTAEFGQPGDITVTSKSGTNQYHGAAFWYHQNRALDARAFSQPSLPAKVSNTFGYTMGGPVLIPKLYSGKNRTFFYFTWESMRLPRQGTVQNTVPTSFVKNGDFSREPGVTIRDPFTRTPFPGNVIPSSRINAVARAILPFYPDINFGDTARRANGNYRANRRIDVESDQYEVRVDHTFNERHSLWGRFNTKSNPSSGANNLTLPNDTNRAKFYQGTATWTWTIKPTLLNEFRFGEVITDSATIFNFDGRAFTNSLNLRDIQKDIFFNGLPAFGITNYTGFSKGRPGFGFSSNSQFVNNVTWIHGRHTIKTGIDIRRLVGQSALGFTTGNNYGDFSFSGNFAGEPFADFLLGTPVSSAIAVVSRDNDGRAKHYKAYIQDTFQISKKLTMDIGVRYELHPGYADAGLNIANFDRNVPRTGRVVIMSDPKAREFVAPGAALSFNACPGAAINGVPCTPIVTAKEAGIPEALRNTYKTQFLPRIGFAYRVNDKTTLRLTYGQYNMILLGSIFFSLTGTVQSDVRNFNNVSATGAPIFTLPDTRTPGSGVRTGAQGTFEFRTANQIDLKPPTMSQWGLSLDRQIGRNLGLRLSYVGNKSSHLPWAPDVNQMPSSNRFFSQRNSLDRPFPNWGLIFSRDAGANAFYNELQWELNRRFSNGLSFTSAYTWAKNLADNAGPAPGSFAGETGGGRVTDSYNRRGDRGDVYATRRHRFINTMVYELPFGAGRKYMSGANRAVDAILGGWQLSSILSLQSGPFLTPTFNGGDPSGTNAASRGASRPDRLGNGEVASPNREGWLDRNAFVCPGRAPGALQFNCAVGVRPGSDPDPIARFGTSGVGIVNGPGTFGLNMAMSKRFRIAERLSLRAEGSFTNLPNWTNLGDPVLDIANNNFGRITGTRGVDFGGARTGQVSLRLEF